MPASASSATGPVIVTVREIAAAAGFDEGLLVDETGRISEGTITNVGFWRDGRVIWPEEPVRVQDLASCPWDEI